MIAFRLRTIAIRFRPQQRKKNNVTNRMRIRQQHRQAVNSQSFSGCRGQALAERSDVVHIQLLWHFVPTARDLLQKSPLLLRRII
jgi:hypothetical protein